MIARLLLLIAALAFPAPAAAQLALALEPVVATPMLGEPVSVIVTLSNQSPTPQAAARRLKPEYDAIQFFITSPSGSRRPFAPFALKESSRPTAVVPPGSAISESADIFFDGGAWTFPQPGTYLVEAFYRETLAAPPVQITVRPPRTPAERTASRLLLASREAGLYLLVQGGENLERGRALVERVAATAPGTPHATHANLVLGVAKARAAPNFRTSTLRAADPAAAVAALERVDFDRLSPERMVRGRLALAASYRKLGRARHAETVERRLDGQLQRRFPKLLPVHRRLLIREALARL